MGGPTRDVTALDNISPRLIQTHKPLHKVVVFILWNVFTFLSSSNPFCNISLPLFFTMAFAYPLPDGTDIVIS